MNDALCFRLLIATVFAGLVLAIFDPTSSPRAKAIAASQAAKSEASVSAAQPSRAALVASVHLPS